MALYVNWTSIKVLKSPTIWYPAPIIRHTSHGIAGDYWIFITLVILSEFMAFLWPLTDLLPLPLSVCLTRTPEGLRCYSWNDPVTLFWIVANLWFTDFPPSFGFGMKLLDFLCLPQIVHFFFGIISSDCRNSHVARLSLDSDFVIIFWKIVKKFCKLLNCQLKNAR